MNTNTPPNPLLRLPRVMDVTGLRPTAIYQRVRDGRLTPPVKNGSRTSVWPQSEIAAINAAVIAGATDDDLRHLVQRLLKARKVAA